MLNRKILIFVIFGMFLISFASADSIGTTRLDEEMQITNYCQTGDCTFMNLISISLPNGTVVYPNISMTKSGQIFNYTYSPNSLGDYLFVTCGDPDGGFICESDNFLVTPNGSNLGLVDIIGILFLILIFISLILVFYNYRNKSNFDSMYKRLINKYEERNYVKFVTNSLWYNILKNSWVIYYTIGFVVMMLIFDITYLFNIESIYRTMKMFLSMYSWGFIVVGMVFISYFQEFIIDMKEELLNNNWGVQNE